MSKKQTDKQLFEKEQKDKEDIVKNVGKDSYETKLKKIKIKPIYRPLDPPEQPIKYLKTNTLLDKILSYEGVGVAPGSSVEFYGEYGTGKTQISEVLVVEAEGLVIYIDTEKTFRRERMVEIAKARGKDVEDVNNRLLLFQPVDWIEQEAIIRQLPEFDKQGDPYEVGIVILDSLMKHFADAPEFHGREKLTQRQQLVRSHLAEIIKYARRHGAVLVFTNQIYDKPVDTTMMAPEKRIGARGGRSLEHIGDYRILLRKMRGNIRVARLVDSPDMPLREVPFILCEKGIDDIPAPEELAKALERTEAYEEKFLSAQVDSKPAGKKYTEQAIERGLIPEEEIEEVEVNEES